MIHIPLWSFIAFSVVQWYAGFYHGWKRITLFAPWLRAKPAKPCGHQAITSRIETFNGRLVHAQDTCRTCGWKSPEFEKEGDATKFYAARL
jgi:hypothetical protein